jgi:hypothetical protein
VKTFPSPNPTVHLRAVRRNLVDERVAPRELRRVVEAANTVVLREVKRLRFSPD